MLSKEISEALEELHKNLKDLAPAIEHVQKAAEVTDLVSEIPMQHLQLLDDLKTSEELYKEGLKVLLQTELESLFDKNNKVVDSLSEVQVKNDQLLDDLKKSDELHKNELKGLLEKEVEKVKKKSNEVSELIVSQIAKTEEYITQIDSNISKIDEYFGKIDSIDFPARLSSIEADLSSMSSAFNNLQGSVNNIQSDMNRRLDEQRDRNEKLKEDVISKHNHEVILMNDLKKQVGGNKTILMIIGAVGVLVTAYIIFR